MIAVICFMQPWPVEGPDVDDESSPPATRAVVSKRTLGDGKGTASPPDPIRICLGSGVTFSQEDACVLVVESSPTCFCKARFTAARFTAARLARQGVAVGTLGVPTRGYLSSNFRLRCASAKAFSITCRDLAAGKQARGGEKCMKR